MEKFTDIGSYFAHYLTLAGEGDAQKVLQNSQERLVSVLHGLSENQWNHSYDEGKWTVKEVIQHCIDTERIMSYRALAFARGEKLSLPGYDEDAYAEESKAGLRDAAFLLSEYEIVRASTVMLFDSFTEEMLHRLGHFSGEHQLKVFQFAELISGHETHHLSVLKERYL
ncbi:MAG: hypothetical protein ACJAU0_000982 [Flavobacteriales bacterium]|jgi:hypothetical protein